MSEIYFKVPFDGQVDRANGIIRGVSLITGNLIAEGHALKVDEKTMEQILASAKDAGKIPVKLDHGSGIKDTCGFITNFARDGKKVRGDWHLLKTHGEYETTMERAERMPECFGLSVAFKGKGETVAGSDCARCEKLLAVDCVTRPAANPDGLFSARVDSGGNGMPGNTSSNAAGAEPTLRDVMREFSTLRENQTRMEQRLDDAIRNFADDDGELTTEDLNRLDAMSDAQLARVGLTRDDVDTAIAAATAPDEDEDAADDGDGDGDMRGEGDEAGEMAGAGAGSYPAGSVGEAFAALERRIFTFEKRQRTALQRQEDAEVEHSFRVVEAKTTELAARNEELTQLVELQAAEIDALRLAVRTGTRPAAAGLEGVHRFGITADGDIHAFTARCKELELSGKSPGEALRMAQKEDPARHADWVESLRGVKAA